jgi:hypothetical protein
MQLRPRRQTAAGWGFDRGFGVEIRREAPAIRLVVSSLGLWGWHWPRQIRQCRCCLCP